MGVFGCERANMIRDKYLNIDKIVEDKAILKLFRAVEANGGILRFVGGAVRDAIAGIGGFDIDLATDLTPDELVEVCEERGFKTVPIGIKYGTVGVVVEGRLFEVTSLRKDISTDGRRAVVEFTDNWEVDASRRDLTINAVYADEKGNVFDYYNGIEDLEKGIVQFIGKPDVRIKEDYLRILRFFRFYSIFGKGPMDEKAFKACVANRKGIKKLSIERIVSEFKKILLTPKAPEVLKIMFDKDILVSILPISTHLNSLEFMMRMTQDNIRPREEMRRLFVLYFPDKKFAESLANRLKFTRKLKDMFLRLATVEVGFEDFEDDTKLMKLIYRYGKEFGMDSFLIHLTKHRIHMEYLNDILDKIESCVVPMFPVRGRDIVSAGVIGNHKIGKILTELEELWLESDFSLNRDDLMKIAADKMKEDAS